MDNLTCPDLGDITSYYGSRQKRWGHLKTWVSVNEDHYSGGRTSIGFSGQQLFLVHESLGTSVFYVFDSSTTVFRVYCYSSKQDSQFGYPRQPNVDSLWVIVLNHRATVTNLIVTSTLTYQPHLLSFFIFVTYYTIFGSANVSNFLT